MNKLAEMTNKAVKTSRELDTLLIRLDTQFNFTTYKWTLYAYCGDGSAFRVDDDLSVHLKDDKELIEEELTEDLNL